MSQCAIQMVMIMHDFNNSKERLCELLFSANRRERSSGDNDSRRAFFQCCNIGRTTGPRDEEAGCLFSGYPFVTNSHSNQAGIRFKYEISTPGDTGRKHDTEPEVEGFEEELLITQTTREKHEKRISRSSLNDALKTALKLQKQGEEITEPEQLNIEGASYIISLFKGFDIGVRHRGHRPLQRITAEDGTIVMQLVTNSGVRL